jgi:hypothetical protein
LKLPRLFTILAVSLIFIFIPLTANADDVIINLSPETIYVDTVVEVTATTEYVIETTNGVRLEQAANGTVTQRVGWIDSWVELRQGDTILRADDDSNHVTGVNEYASKITGTINSGLYTIRATSYLNRVANATPTGTYTLSSNLIHQVVEPVPQEPQPLPPDPLENQTQIPVTPEPTTPSEPAVEPPVVQPVQPEPLEPPVIPQEPPLVEDTVAEEPPVEAEEPPTPVEEPPTEAEVPPVEEEQPPVEAEEPPLEEETPPTPVEEAPPTVEEAAAEVIAEADGEAITAEAMEEAGITYEDLPPETPVEVRTDEDGNEVVVTAVVAAALEIFESPSELISAIFENPAQVITAIANIGADMSDEEREESEKIIVASVIAGQAAVNAATMAAGAATRVPAPTPSTPAGGPAAGNDKPRSSRRRKP